MMGLMENSSGAWERFVVDPNHVSILKRHTTKTLRLDNENEDDDEYEAKERCPISYSSSCSSSSSSSSSIFAFLRWVLKLKAVTAKLRIYRHKKNRGGSR